MKEKRTEKKREKKNRLKLGRKIEWWARKLSSWNLKKRTGERTGLTAPSTELSSFEERAIGESTRGPAVAEHREILRVPDSCGGFFADRAGWAAAAATAAEAACADSVRILCRLSSLRILCGSRWLGGGSGGSGLCGFSSLRILWGSRWLGGGSGLCGFCADSLLCLVPFEKPDGASLCESLISSWRFLFCGSLCGFFAVSFRKRCRGHFLDDFWRTSDYLELTNDGTLLGFIFKSCPLLDWTRKCISKRNFTAVLVLRLDLSFHWWRWSSIFTGFVWMVSSFTGLHWMLSSLYRTTTALSNFSVYGRLRVFPSVSTQTA